MSISCCQLLSSFPSSAQGIWPLVLVHISSPTTWPSLASSARDPCSLSPFPFPTPTKYVSPLKPLHFLLLFLNVPSRKNVFVDLDSSLLQSLFKALSHGPSSSAFISPWSALTAAFSPGLPVSPSSCRTCCCCYHMWFLFCLSIVLLLQSSVSFL